MTAPISSISAAVRSPYLRDTRSIKRIDIGDSVVWWVRTIGPEFFAGICSRRKIAERIETTIRKYIRSRLRHENTTFIGCRHPSSPATPIPKFRLPQPSRYSPPNLDSATLSRTYNYVAAAICLTPYGVQRRFTIMTLLSVDGLLRMVKMIDSVITEPIKTGSVSKSGIV
jgi:hypothetical protein